MKKYMAYRTSRKRAGIERNHQKKGKYGEELFSKYGFMFFSQIVGMSEEYCRINARGFRLRDISERHLQHDFVLETPLGNMYRVEVKTRASDYYSNVV